MTVVLILLSALFLILSLQLIKFFKIYHRNRKCVEHIPCPPEKKFLGHLYILTTEPAVMFYKLREMAKMYFPIYRLSTFYVNIISILDPNDIEIVLSSTKHLSKSKVYTFLYNWLGTGLLTSTGEKWHKRRKILTPAFHFKILQEFVEIFNNESLKLVDKLDTGIIDVVPPITNYTLQSILETAMGLTGVDEERTKRYKKGVYELGEVFFQRLKVPWYRIDALYNLSKTRKLEHDIVQDLHNFSNSVITKRQGTIGTKRKRMAMLDLLLSAKNEGTDIDFEGIREEVDTFMFEGHDTTAMAISYFLLALANHPEHQSQVFEEIISILGTDGIPTIENLQELKYTECCIKESLRLFPSVPLISRYAGEEFQTNSGFTIPKDSVVHIHIFDIHRNENLYPDPLKFDPSRFSLENSQNRHPFAYIPFSAGPRNCIGQKFAMLEMKIAICWLFRKFEFRKADEMHDVKFRPDLVLRPQDQVRVKVVPR